MERTNEIMNELADMANFKGFGESEEEILNPDGSRNWQANILLDNVKRLEQENAELKAENERLKEELSGKRFICKDCMAFAKRIEQYKQTLQEIKAIASGDYEMLDPQALQEIRNILTKAESEG